MQTEEPAATAEEALPESVVGTRRPEATLLTDTPVATSSGSTYYVAVTGDDSNPGTLSRPWKTIRKAVSIAQPGDTVYVREGNYTERVTFRRSGSERHPVSNVLLTDDDKATFATNLHGVSVGDYLYVYRSWKSNNGAHAVVEVGSNYVRVEGSPFVDETTNAKASIATPIVFRTYQGETVIIDKANNNAPNVNFNHVDYIIMDGFAVTRSAHAGVSFIGGRHNVFRDGKVYRNDRPGFHLIDASAYNLIEGNEIYENGQHGEGEGIYIGKSPEDGGYDASDYNHVVHNHIHDTLAGPEGIDIKIGISYSVIEGNVFEHNNSYWGVILLAGPNTLVYRNDINGGEGSAGWAGFVYVDSPDNHLFNNVIYGSATLDGIYLFRYPGNKIRHNSIYGCHGGIGIDSDAGSMTGTEIINNMLSNNTDQLYGDVAGVTIAYNVFDGPSTIYGSYAITDTSRFVNPAGGDFHLQPDSPAIDAGTDAGVDADFDGAPRPQGAGFDIGAYEYPSVRLSAWARESTAHLSWISHQNLDPRGYSVYYESQTGGPANEGASPIDVPDPDQQTIQLTGLTMYSLYEAWIEPYDGNGHPLPESNHITFLPTDHFNFLPLALRA